LAQKIMALLRGEQWRHYTKEIEPTIAAFAQSERAAAEAARQEELETAAADADNARSYAASLKEAIRQLCEIIGVERGHDHSPDFLNRARAAVTAAEAATIERCAVAAAGHDPDRRGMSDIGDAYLMGRRSAVADIRALAAAPLGEGGTGNA
jgi:hypothetical protein